MSQSMNPEILRYLRILELESDATLEDVRRAYRDMVSVWHPDRFVGNERLREKAESKIRLFNEAHARLVSALGEAVVEEDEICPAGQGRGKRVIAVASGKGGVGKTNFTVNLALALGEAGHEVMILDADLGMANVDVICGISPRAGLHDVLLGRRGLADVVVTPFPKVTIVPGVSGVEQLTSLTPSLQNQFFQALAAYEREDDSDIVLIDIGAGMGPTVVNLMLAAGEAIVVITPEPTSLTDAYALIKTVIGKNPQLVVRVVVNMIRQDGEGRRAFDSLQRICQRFLGIDPVCLGYITWDDSVPHSVRQQRPYLVARPRSEAARCVRRIATRLTGTDMTPEPPAGGIGRFFKRMSSFLSRA